MSEEVRVTLGEGHYDRDADDEDDSLEGGHPSNLDLEGSIVVGGTHRRRDSVHRRIDSAHKRRDSASCSCSSSNSSRRSSCCSCSSSSSSSRGYSPSGESAIDEEPQRPDDEIDLPYPGFRPVTMFCLSQTSRPRDLCLRIVTNPWFERLCMAVIILNCVTLGLYRPCADELCDSARCRVLRVFDHLIFGFFAVEMTVKMTAMGAMGKDAYLSETWNRLDFFIVIAGSLEYCLDMGNINLSAIRTVRVLRPLKAINRIPSLRILVMLLLDTLPMLGNVLLLCFFVFFVFGIVGVQMWAGLLRQRCYLQLPSNASIMPPGYLSPYYYRRVKLLNPVSTFYQSSSAEAERDYVCSMDKDSGVHRCEDFPPTRMAGKRCNFSAWQEEEVDGGDCVNWNQYYTQCRAGDRNPFQGAISFDNIGLAWVAIFLVISLEGWTDIMYYVQDAHSFWDFTYFVLLIVVGSFFMINLCLVVIATQFSETKKREMERMRMERARFHSSSTLASASASSAAGCYTQLFKYAAHLGRRARRRGMRFFRGRRKAAHAPPPSISLRTNKKTGRWHPGQSSLKSPESTLTGDPGSPMAPYASPEISDIDPSPRDIEDGKGCVELLAAQGAVLAGFGNTFGVLYSDMEKGDKQHVSAPQLLFYSPETGECWSEGRGRSPSCDGGAGEAWFRWWGRQQSKVKSLTDHRYFQRGILAAILVNTLSMGIEYHNQPAELTLAVELSNVLFTAVFCLEMVLKMVAEGFCSYISSGFNVFDSVIVVLSLVELCQSSDGTGGSGLSVLRTFRLLRILKLVRFLPALRRQLIIMLRTVDNVAIFFALLILFIFIFSILGMNLFGCKFCKKLTDGGTQCDRKNFDSLLWAIVTVFQILTQEDWNVVLFNGMEKTSHWAALYFVALMTFGNYVLFNLLVAILVEGFSQEDDKRDSDNLSPSCSLCEKQDCETSDEKENDKWLRDEDPKDNIEKEIKMKAYVLRVVRPGSEGGPPPLITHTAATPQGSPNATLPPPPRDRIPDTLEKTPLQPGEVVLQLQPQDSSSRRSSSVILALSRQSSIISNISRKNSLGPCFGLQGGVNGWRAHYRRKKSESSDNGSGSEDVILNNMTASHSPSPAFENGSIPTLLQNTPNNKRNSSVRSSSLSQYRDAHNTSINGGSPAPGRLSSVCSLHNDTEDNFKTNNLEEDIVEKDEEAMSTECELPTKLCWFIKPKGWLKEREDYSLFIFSRSNWLRRGCTRLSNNHWFDSGILVFIASNCVTLAMERPTIPPDSGERMFLTCANYTFTAVFTFEMAVKVVSTGLWYGRGAYFRSGWNVMDGIVVAISLVDLLLSFAAEGSPKIFGILRVFRLLRSLRPLRVINRAPGLKLVVQTLLSSLRPIGNIVLICCTFFVIFGILGVQLFKGSMYYCEGPTAARVRNKVECLQDPRNLWLNRKYNFDNLGQALMSLFVLSSKDGWVNIMYTGLDAVGVDQQPIENYNEWRLLYFISFLLLVAFFVLNMFVGVVVENFHRCREQQEREERARRAAKRAKKMDRKRRKMRAPPYYADYSKARLSLHNVITSKYFDLAIAAVIGLNVVTMAMEFYMMPKNLEYALKVFNYFFTAVFIAEAGMKVFALGILKYLKNRWNQLDIAIVFLSIAGIALEKMESDLIPINPTIIRVFRVMRIARVLKLLKMAKGIRALLDTVMQALPQVGNLGLLFFLLFFIFAALGVELFGRLECTEDLPCEGLGEHAHFKDFGMAFLTLFRVATGDNWNGIMKDTLRDNCDSSGDCVVNCCVSPLIAPLYFVVFVLMAQFVLVNVVVAVLMKHLEESHKQMDDDAEMDAELRAEFDAEEQRRRLGEQADKLKRAQTMRCQSTTVPTRPLLVKMASLPPDFVFPFDTPNDRGFRRASLNLQNYRGIPTPDLGVPFPNRRSPTPDINIRRASPDESKVSVANLSPVPPPSPPPPPPDDWSCVVDSSLNPSSNSRLLSVVQETTSRADAGDVCPKRNGRVDGMLQTDVSMPEAKSSTSDRSPPTSLQERSLLVPKVNIHGDMDARAYSTRDDAESYFFIAKVNAQANDDRVSDRGIFMVRGISHDGNLAEEYRDDDRFVSIAKVISPVGDKILKERLLKQFIKVESNSDRALAEKSLCATDVLPSKGKSDRDSKLTSNDIIPITKVSTPAGDKIIPNERLLSANFRCFSVPTENSPTENPPVERLPSTRENSTSKVNNNKTPLGSRDDDVSSPVSKVNNRDGKDYVVINKVDSPDLLSLLNVHSGTCKPTKSKDGFEPKSDAERMDAKSYSNTTFIECMEELDKDNESILVSESLDSESPSVLNRLPDSSLSSSDRINDNTDSTSFDC